MIRVSCVLAVGFCAAMWLASASTAPAADDAAAQDQPQVKSDKAAKTPAPAAKPKRELSPELASLRDSVRQALAAQRKQPFNTGENSAADIISYCLAFGCTTEVSLGQSDGQRANGITCLCWNYPCGGFELLRPTKDHIAARIGYGYQSQPGEFLAMLALSRVPENYPLRAASRTRSVSDLIEAEKLACRSGSDMSLRLIGLSYYVDEPEWKNDLGETWSLERIVADEMGQPVVTAPEGGLNRLMGLSFAVSRRAKRGLPIEGQFQRAEKYAASFQDFALQLQNSDGSWGPYFLAARSASREPASQLRSTGRVLEWLALSMTDRKLEDPRVMKAVEYVAGLLDGQRYDWNATSLSARDVAALGHALHGLSVYDDRVFKPADVPATEKPAADKAPAAARRDADESKTR
jgi:hypothetical protein